MRLVALLIIAMLGGVAVIVANQHRPFELRIDAAQPNEGRANLLTTPCPLTPQNLPVLNAERKA